MMDTTQPTRPMHSSAYACSLTGVAVLALHRWRENLEYHKNAKHQENRDLCAAKAQAYHEILNLITGMRDEDRIVESIRAMA